MAILIMHLLHICQGIVITYSFFFFKHTYIFQIFHDENIVTFINKKNYFLENNKELS